MFYLLLFLAFLYSKIARVHKKEERVTARHTLSHVLAALAGTALAVYGIMYEHRYLMLPSALLFFILSSLMITAVQLGIFVDGKPMLGLTRIYHALPLLSVVLCVSVIGLWLLHVA